MSFLKEYTLLGELGTGGFAKVYKVRHNTLGYIRAIRVLNEPVTDENSRTYQKFLRECIVLLRLGNGSQPNIVHMTDLPVFCILGGRLLVHRCDVYAENK